MKNTSTQSRIKEIIASIFILVFVYTAVSKLLDYNGFHAVLSQSFLFSNAATLVSIFIPAIELLISFLLLIPRYRAAGLKASFTLMLIFSVYIMLMLFLADNLPCSCGGILQELSWSAHLAVNLVLSLLAAFAIWQHKLTQLFIAINRRS